MSLQQTLTVFELLDSAHIDGQQVVDLFGNLPREEAWLLSVHIEVARSNN